MTWEQPELSLEWATPPDHYTIELRRGPQHDESEPLRRHTARNVHDAEAFIEALRDLSFNRDEVTWQTTEVNADGEMYGLAPGGVVYVLSVTPPLTVALS